jgi:rare lipoprotein A (peptidoglycan hydrolase)
MRRSRIRRRRALAALLVPAAALTIGSAISSAQVERQAAFDSGKASVRYGDKVVLRGQFPGAPNAAVTIVHRRAGAKHFHPVMQTRTNDRGRWRVRVRPRGTGLWRARLSNAPRTAEPSDDSLLEGETAPTAVDSESNRKRVAVRSITRARAKNHAVAGRSVRIKGRVRPGGRRKVVVTAGGERMRTRTDRRGRFDVNWRPNSTGTYRVKAKARGNREAKGSSDGAGKVTVYRHASASWYGPGLYGNSTACGQTLASSTLGVAHKSMPCGTKLKLRHSGNTVKVRVIDRGPYVAGREFDLTEATKNRLGFGSTGTVLSSK